MLPPINFYRMRIKDQVIITRIKKSFKVNNFSCLVLPAHMEFMHLVLSLLVVVPARLKSNPDYRCSISSEIHLLHLKFAFFL